MKRLLVVLFSLASCAAVQSRPEAEVCPSPMSNAQYMSGAMQCRALCSSYGRDYEAFDLQCRCICQPEKRGAYSASL